MEPTQKEREEGLIYILNRKLLEMWAESFSELQSLKKYQKEEAHSLPCGDQDALGDEIESTSNFVKLLEDVYTNKTLTIKRR